MAARILKKITQRIRKAWAEAAPPAGPSTPNPFCRVMGRLSLRNAATLREGLWAMLRTRNRSIALDCSQIRFMDGGALAVMIEFAYKCRQEGVSLRLIDPSHEMCNVFSLYGLGEVLVEICEFKEIELDGVVVLVEDDFPDSIRLPALVVEDEPFQDSIRLPALSKARISDDKKPWRDAA